MALSYAELEGYWIAAGGNKALAPLMAAIALAESSGNPDAENPNDNGGTQTSWGLWQISLGNHSEPSPSWNDPLTNAKLAVGKYNSQGLGAWGTYSSGAYKQFMQNGVVPQNSSGITSTQQQGTVTQASFSSDIGSAITDGFLSGLKTVLPPVLKEFMWFAQVGLGVVIMFIGAFILLQQSKTVQGAEKTAIRFTPEGRAVSVGGAALPKGPRPVAAPKPKAEVNPYSGGRVRSPQREQAAVVKRKNTAAAKRVDRARVKSANERMKSA